MIRPYWLGRIKNPSYKIDNPLSRIAANYPLAFSIKTAYYTYVDIHSALRLVLNPAVILTESNLTPDSWQRDLLFSVDRYLLLNCSRQSGKSTTVAALALYQALVEPKSLILLLAPTYRQSRELFRKIVALHHGLGDPLPTTKASESEMEWANGSRLVALPGKEETVRSFSGVSLLVIDEAARVPDDLYRSVRPMLAVSQGRLVALSTPFGRRGWFFEEWAGQGPWRRVQITWRDCPRITPAFIDEETRAMGQAWVDQEYGCQFTALEGLVYPDFPSAVVGAQPLPDGKRVGGIDFGWRNPFAAVWGVLDRDDVLWIEGERYETETPLGEHAAQLPKGVMWYADPSGRTEIEELRRADLKVAKADNNVRRGIMAVTERIRTGRLKVFRSCRHLIQEAGLYRYPNDAEREVHGENPIDAHNHALDALRYVVSRLPRRKQEHRPETVELSRPRKWDDEKWWSPL